MGLLDETDDLLERGVAADFGCAETQGAGGVYGCTKNGVAGVFLDGEAFTGEHGFIDGGGAGFDGAIDRDFFAGSDNDGVTDDDLTDGDVKLDRGLALYRCTEDSRGSGLEADKFADSGAGAAGGAGLEQFAEQYQNDDDGGGLEVNRVHLGVGGGVGVICLCCGVGGDEERGVNGCGDGVKERRTGAEGDEGIHPGAEVFEAEPGAAEKLAAAPDDDGGGKGQLKPVDPCVIEEGNSAVRHGNDEHGEGESCTDDDFTADSSLLGVSAVLVVVGFVDNRFRRLC